MHRCTTSPNKDTVISHKVWLNRLTSGLEGQDCWTLRCWLGSVSWKTAWWRLRIWNVMSPDMLVILLSLKHADAQWQLRCNRNGCTFSCCPLAWFPVQTLWNAPPSLLGVDSEPGYIWLPWKPPRVPSDIRFPRSSGRAHCRLGKGKHQWV